MYLYHFLVFFMFVSSLMTLQVQWLPFICDKMLFTFLGSQYAEHIHHIMGWHLHRTMDRFWNNGKYRNLKFYPSNMVTSQCFKGTVASLDTLSLVCWIFFGFVLLTIFWLFEMGVFLHYFSEFSLFYSNTNTSLIF